MEVVPRRLFAPMEKSSFLPQIPKVNLATGEYCEEACDLVVAGSEPISIRRFYSHSSGHSEQMYGHWRMNPETFMLFNFEPAQKSKTYVGTGKKNGSFVLYDQGITSGFRLNPDKNTGYTHQQLSGQHHPLNTRISFRKGTRQHKSGILFDPETHCWWEGSIKEGNGEEWFFRTDVRQWPQMGNEQPQRSWQHPASLEREYETLPFQPPYQGQVVKQRRPSGNVICYEYVDCNATNPYVWRILPTSYALKSIKAYSSTGMLLGSIEIDHTSHSFRGLRAYFQLMDRVTFRGSDGRAAVYVQPQRTVHKGVEYDTVLERVISSGNPVLRYQYQNYRTKRNNGYVRAPLMCHVGQEEGSFYKTTYENDRKVAAQSAPVGPSGEIVPIARYEYGNDFTIVYDAENNKTLYRFDKDKRIIAEEKYLQGALYSIEKNTWNPSTGNLLKKSLEDAAGKVYQSTDYVYDANHNVIEEKILGSTPVYRTYSADGWNLKLMESDRPGKKVHYSYVPGTNLLKSELVTFQGEIVKRTFHFYNRALGAVCVKTIVDDGTSEHFEDLSGVTYRHVTETNPKSTLPCIGLPEEVREYAGDHLLKKERYTYHPSGKVLTEEHYDANNQHCYTIQNIYDDQERLISTTDPLENQTSFTYDANHNLTSITGPNPGQYKEIVYDQANRPIRISDRQADGSILTIEKKYDRLGQVIAETDACGNETRFAYDILGRVTAVYHPDGSIEQNEYDVLGNVTKAIDGEGYETCTTYNFQGKPMAIYYPDGQEEHFTYNCTGTVATHIDKNGAKSVYTYDLFDRPTEITVYSSAGDVLKTTHSTYSSFCKLSETDGEGVVTTFTYDFCGRKIAEQTDTKKIVYAYDALGRLTKTDTGAFQTIEIFDNADRVIAKQILDDAGNLQFKEEYAYDASGNRTHLINSKGAYETLYNSFGKPLLEKNPLGFGTTYAYKYDKEHTETSTDPNGIQTVRVYDARGRESEVRKLNRSGKVIAQSFNHYNKTGKLIQLNYIVFDGTTPRTTITHQWEYGPMGRLERFVEAGEKETQYFYDEQGRLATIKKPSGVEIHHEWDELGRLVRYFSSDFDYTYTYDSNDRLVTVYDAVTKKKTTRAYNALGDMVQETLANGLKILNDFDPQGRRVALTLPDASSIDYAYQGAYLHTAGRHNAQFVYEQRDLQGNFNLATLPHQLGQISINRDPLSRWQAFDSPYYQAQFSEKAYDPNGNLLHYSYEDSLGKAECSYEYDDHNQLISENEHSYQFDSLHNRLRKDDLSHEVNALCQTLHDGRTAYEYDLDGNLTFDGEWCYIYDTQDRLIALEKDSKRVEYTYDPFHRRLSKQVFSKNKQIHSERYLWDGDNEIGALSDRDKIEQIRVLGEGLGAEIGSSVFYELKGKTYVPIHDHRGCVVALVDPKAQKAIESYRYTAFGEELTGGTLSPWRFSSKRVEEETGLLFFGRRYYHPALGKWITQDPEGLENGPNLYAYVSNCPLVRFDLYGLREYFPDYDALDFPGLSYSTLLRANRVDPYFSQFESSFTHKSHIYNLSERPSLPDGAWIGFCNGIRNNQEQAKENLIHLSDLSGGYNLHGMYRGSRNTMVDLMGCWMGYQGTTTDAVSIIHQAWDEQFDKVPDSLLLHFCTSGGAISTKQALIEYSDERRKNIRVVAIAPADYISGDLCHSVQHYEAHLWRDAIPWIRWKERWKNRDTIRVLPSHPTADLHDHSFQSKTFESSINYEIRYYNKLIGK